MSQVSRPEAERIMRERGWLPIVPDDFRSEVLRQSVLMRYRSGDSIIHLGDAPGGIFGLVTGTVRISVAPSGSMPRLLMLGVPGHWTGEACFLTNKPRRGDMSAVVDTTMFHLPLDIMNRMAARDPRVIHYFSLILMMSVEFLMQIIHDLQKPEAGRRIASVLQRTTSIGDVPIPLTQEELGIMANASRKRVNAILKRFEEEGWLTYTYRSITITNVAALRKFAEGEDAE